MSPAQSFTNPVTFRRFLLALTLLTLLSAPAFALAPNQVYDIGPGETYTTIGSFPWSSLLPGDTVQIHYATYHETIGITGRGTATRPIRVVGIPNASGDLPIIDGAGGVAAGPNLNLQFSHGTAERGLVDITPYGNAPAGYKPGYIEVSNLVVENAFEGNPITYADSTTGAFTGASSSIYIVAGEHIVITHCTITGSSNGFFVNSGGDGANGDGTEATEARDITVQYCSIYGNGLPGSEGNHNIYTEGSGMVFQYNYLGLPLSTGGGNNLKDRSAGTVIRYNWIASGGHMLDLDDPQESSNVTTQEPSFPYTYVYGNVFYNTFTLNLIHYGGDQGIPANDRDGTIYVYNNTVITQANQSSLFQVQLLELTDSGLSTQTGDQHADVRNNIFYVEPATAGDNPPIFDFGADGPDAIGVNWVAPGWGAGYNLSTSPNVTGTNNLFVDSTDNPGFNNLAGLDFTLTAGSDAIDLGGPPASAVTSNPMNQNYSVNRQLASSPLSTINPTGEARQVNGAAMDLGAFEAGAPGPSSVIFYPAAATLPAAGGNATVEVLADPTSPDWSATSNDPWLGIVSGSPDVTADVPGNLEYSSTANTASALNGSLTIDGLPFNVLQLGPDTTPPTVSITAPNNNADVSGTSVPVTATAADGEGVASVQFILDNSTYISDVLTVPPFTMAWDSTTVNPGSVHTISAVATDMSGNTTTSEPVTITTAATPAAETPVFNATAGNYTAPVSVTISSITPSSTIYFTTNGSTPTTMSTAYANPITVSTAETIKAIATASGFTQSAVGSAAYTIGTVTGATHFAVSAPTTATAGQSINVVVTAENASNTVVTGYAGTVHFTSTDGSAVLPANATLTNGVGTFSATLNTGGSQTVTATDTATSSITGTSGAINVVTQATHYVVSAPASATAGTAFSFIVTAKDVNGNTVTTYPGIAHFSSSDGAATLPGNTTLTNGIGAFSATLHTAGNQTITGTDTVAPSITGSTAAINVTTTGATHFSISAPASTTAGSTFSITVTALTAGGTTATNYSGIVHFASTDTQGPPPANSTLTNGVKSFNVALRTAGIQSFTATDTVSPSIAGTSPGISVAPYKASKLIVSAPASATSGTPFNVTVTAIDAFKNLATGYTGTVHFTSSDGSATLPANAPLTNGLGTFSATLSTTGNQTVTATDASTSSITGTSGAIAVAAGSNHLVITAPANATVGSPITFTVKAENGSGATLTSYTGTVHFTSSDSAATLPTNSTLTSGVGSFSATLRTTGNQTITGTDTVTSSIRGTSSAIDVAAVVTGGIHFTVSVPATLVAGSTFSITVTALNSGGTTDTGYTGTVHFTTTDPQGSAPANATLTNGAGTFKAAYRTAGSQTVTATDTVTSTITGTSNATAVSPFSPHVFTLTVPSSATAGTPFNFTITVKDAFGNTTPSYSGTVQFSSSDPSATLPANTTLTNGTKTLSATLKTAGKHTITGTDTVSTGIKGTSAAITVP